MVGQPPPTTEGPQARQMGQRGRSAATPGATRALTAALTAAVGDATGAGVEAEVETSDVASRESRRLRASSPDPAP